MLFAFSERISKVNIYEASNQWTCWILLKLHTGKLLPLHDFENVSKRNQVLKNWQLLQYIKQGVG